MNFSDYRSAPGVNWSSLKNMRVSPLHYQYWLTTEREETDAMKVGSAVHSAVFEPHKLSSEYVLWTGGRRYGKDWDAFVAAAGERTILTLDEYQRAVNIGTAVRNHPLVKPYLVDGQAEYSIRWKDEKSGLECKARVDMLNAVGLSDLKTSKDAVDPRQFASAAYRLGYYCQAEFYRRGVEAVTGKPPASMVFIAVESSPPHDVVVFRPTEDALYFAGQEIDRLLARLKECRETNTWPGCFSEPVALELPGWAVPSIDDVDLSDPDWMKGP